MKTILNTFLLLLFAFTANGQTIPNSSFEHWQSTPFWTYDPEFWTTNNTKFIFPVTQNSNYVTDSTYSMRINGYYRGYAACSIPATVHPLQFELYTMCTVNSGDKIFAKVEVIENGQIVDSGYWQTTASISNFQLIQIPITQNSTTCDNVIITLSGGDSMNTDVYFDELAFTDPNGINELKNETVVSLSQNVFHESTIVYIQKNMIHFLQLFIIAKAC